MLNLIAKDIKLLLGGKEKGVSLFLRVLFLVLGLGVLVFVESYLYREILTKLSSFPGASLSFTTLFLFIVSLFSILFSLLQAEKLLFDESDRRDMDILPISPTKKIFSKLILLLGSHYLLDFLFVYPVLLSYGLVFRKLVFFYFLGIFYPLMTFFFEVGLALALVYPFHYLKQLLSSRPYLEFIVIAILLGLGAFAYAKLLDVFVSLVSGSGINAFLTDANLSKMVANRKYWVVANYLVQLFFAGSSSGLLLWAAFSLFVFILGLLLSVPFYSRNIGGGAKAHVRVPKIRFKPLSPEKAYFKKEFILLFRDSTSLFSFAGFLLLSPYLAYSILYALNTVFSSGTVAYYFVSFPNLATYINFFALLMLFLCVSSGGMDYFGREGEAMKILKTIPFSPMKQLVLKFAPTFLASSVSFLITSIVVSSTGVLGAGATWLAYLFGEVALFSLSLLRLMEEMKKTRSGANLTLLSSLYSYGAPFLFLGIAALFSFLRLPVGAIYLIAFAVLLTISLPGVLYFMKQKKNLWDNMEVGN